MEIERKWLVDKEKCPGLVLYDAEVLRTVQGYLNTIKDEWLIRVRKIKKIGTNRKPQRKSSEFYLELKTQGLLSREELRYIIHEEEFIKTLRKCSGVVKKTRYCWMEDNTYFEVDVYDDHDFVTCEVEFKTEKEAENFKAPSWCLRDVTYDPKYKNVNLAVK
jgi:adenylate cyclase